MNRSRLAILLIAAAAMLPTGSVGAAAVIACISPIMACGCTITTTGVYVVGQALTGTAGQDCIDIKAKDVDLDTEGWPITGPGATGIWVEKAAKSSTVNMNSVASGITTISGFDTGIVDDAPGAVIEGGEIIGSISEGIVVNKVKGGLIDALILDSNGTSGIDLESCTNFVVSAAYVQSNGVNGLVMFKGKNNLVSFSTIIENTQDGVFVNGGSNNVFDGNTFDDNLGGSGIDLFSTKDNVLSANTMDLNSVYGLWLDQSSGNTVVNFAASGNAQTGIYSGCAATGGPNQTACTPVSKASTANVIVDGGTNLSGNLYTQQYGVALDLGDTGSIVTGVAGAKNGIDDAFDANASCSTDRWTNNNFGVPNAGCIQ
jgi:parallel beta-helix repeat protein